MDFDINTGAPHSMQNIARLAPGHREKEGKDTYYKGSGDDVGMEEFIQLALRGAASAAEMGNAEGTGGAGAVIGFLQRIAGKE